MMAEQQRDGQLLQPRGDPAQYAEHPQAEARRD